MVLQFIGIYAVVKELRSTQRQFGKPGVRQTLHEWVQRWPTRNVTVAVSGLAAASATGTARARVRSGTKPGATVEEHVAAIEQNIGRIDDELSEVQREVDMERRERTSAVQEEADARARDVAQVSKRIEETATSAVPFSLFGVVCLFAGVLIATAAPELAAWIKLLSRWL